MKITSPAFGNNQQIPKKYSCQGENINPPLLFSDIPQRAKSLVLVMDDPDAPMGTFVHWVLYNINISEKETPENSTPKSAAQGVTGAGRQGYIGPCPPSGTHRYFFKLYALDNILDAGVGANKQEIENKMQGHILETSELVGLYEKK